MAKLDIFANGKDHWEIIKTIEAKTFKECLKIAKNKYDTQNYLWSTYEINDTEKADQQRNGLRSEQR